MKQRLSAPLDVRLMNATAAVLFMAVGALGLTAILWMGAQHPVFSIAAINVQGDIAHNSAVTLRNHVAPRLFGNFFTLDLDAAREAFEATPWVRSAVIRREFPNRLSVQLQEHQAVAYWGAESESSMVNSFGEVFEANVDDVEADALPRLVGPQGQSAPLLAMYERLVPLFRPMGATVEQLDLSERGSWRVQLDSGTVVELGRGTPEELVGRIQRFVGTMAQALTSYSRTPDAIESVDLRHGRGYALRLRGVTTVTGDAPEPRK
jgi:cell division protein FtsQ